jgi:hypothetical protein
VGGFECPAFSVCSTNRNKLLLNTAMRTYPSMRLQRRGYGEQVLEILALRRPTGYSQSHGRTWDLTKPDQPCDIYGSLLSN